MNIEFGGHVGFNGVQKPAEFLRTMAALQLTNDAAGLQLQSGEQRGRPVTFVIVRAALDLPRS